MTPSRAAHCSRHSERRCTAARVVVIAAGTVQRRPPDSDLNRSRGIGLTPRICDYPPRMAKVLVVEDDVALRGVLLRGLREEGFEAVGVGSATELLDRIEPEAPNLLIVDIGLPDADGRDICQALRAQGVQTPVLFLSARDALTDRVTGFSAGGDDYVTKPFAFAELVARLHALLRRAGETGIVEQSGLVLDPMAHAAFVGGKKISLTPTEFRLLAKLVASPGQAIRRRELVQTGWPHGAQVRDNTLDAYIARLRRKLGSQDGAPTIATVHGVGYAIE
jgi:two-component system response regulator MprA